MASSFDSKPPSPQPSPQGEREYGRTLCNGVSSPLGERDRVRGDVTVKKFGPLV
jgi:hypothetical protein